jgi:repressor LexA
MRTKSTELMSKIIDCIEKEYIDNGNIPTMREIALKLGISKSCVSKYIAEMQKKGMLEHTNGWHNIKTSNMTKVKNEALYLPVVGSIACGTPLLAEENIETYLPIPKDFLGCGSFFILRANGNSMINVGIDSGDLVIVRQQETAEKGQIVVALIDDEATLKRYYIDARKKKIRLHPENDNMQDMYFDKISIQGVAVKVIKDLK